MSTVLWIMTLVLALVSSSNSVNDSLPSSLEVKMKYNFTDEQLEMKRSNGMLEDFKKFIRELSKKDEVIVKKDEVIAKKDELIAKKDEEIVKKDKLIVKKDKVILKVTGKMESFAFVCAQILARSSNSIIFKKIFNNKIKLDKGYKVNDDSPVCQPLLKENRDNGSTERKNRHKWLQSIYQSNEPYANQLRHEIMKSFYNHSDPRIKTDAFMLCACTFAKQERIGNIYAHELEKLVHILKSTRNEGFAVASRRLIQEDKVKLAHILITHDEFKCLYALVLTAVKQELQWIPYEKDEDYIIPQVNSKNCALPNHLEAALML